MIWLAAVAGLVLAAQAPDWAANPPPRLPGTMQPTLDQFRYFTDCVVSAQWVTTRPLFETAMGSDDEHRVLQNILGGDYGNECLYVLRMRMTSTLMRGGLAESRYRLVYGRDPASPINTESAPVPEGASFQWVGFGRHSPPSQLFAFATCLAAREPGAVHALLMTRIGRSDERNAFQALSRRFGACLAPGQRLSANSLTFRPFLAEAMYQQARMRRPDP